MWSRTKCPCSYVNRLEMSSKLYLLWVVSLCLPSRVRRHYMSHWLHPQFSVGVQCRAMCTLFTFLKIPPGGERHFDFFCRAIKRNFVVISWKRAIMTTDLLPYTELSVQRNTFLYTNLMKYVRNLQKYRKEFVMGFKKAPAALGWF